MVVRRNFVLDAGEYAELAFDGYIELVGVVDNLLREGYVLLVGQVRAVDHHRREAEVDAALAELERIAVVEVKNDLGLLPAEFLGVLDGTLSHVAQQCGVGIVAGAFRHLKDHGRLLGSGGLDDGLELLHVVEVEGGDSVTTLDGLGKHLASVYKT